MRTTLLALLFLAIMPLAAWAQTDTLKPPTAPATPSNTLASELDDENFFGVGLQVGLATGSGVTVRYSLANRFVFEVNGIYLAINDPLWTVGFEGQYRLNTTTNSSLYALAGAGFYYAAKSDTNELAEPTNKLDAPVRAGVGVGYEWFISRNFSLAIELPVTIFIQDEIAVLPLPQLQVVYYFK